MSFVPFSPLGLLRGISIAVTDVSAGRGAISGIPLSEK
jgi:hypothetical protein